MDAIPLSCDAFLISMVTQLFTMEHREITIQSQQATLPVLFTRASDCSSICVNVYRMMFFLPFDDASFENYFACNSAH